MLNLLSNAIKFSKEKGNIDVNVYLKDKYVVLEVKDNGIGIKKGEITRVFEKGFTGTNGRKVGQKSTGMGLYLCKKLCNKLGLRIELDSEENIGTEIRIAFPKSSFIQDAIE